jgi:ABC-2 type transport system permease protein
VEAATARDSTMRAPGFAVVARQELRDLWLGGRGVALLLAFSVLISVITYLSATNQSVNFLEQHEAVNLTLQVGVAVGGLLALLIGADAVSGERERGTLESLLLTPVPRAQLIAGKLVAALSVWFAAMIVTVPYVWFLGRDVGAVGDAIGSGFGVGTLIALGLAGFGLVVSTLARSNRLSLSVTLLVLLGLFAPTQLPTGAQQGWAGDLLLRVNPVSAGLHYIGKVVVNQHDWGQDFSWLISPIAASVVFGVLALALAPRLLTLQGGGAR